MDEYENDELMHYGVKGMKWGVRKDARLLANHTRNQAVKDAKKQYKKGSISKEQKKAAIAKANTTLKSAKKNTKSAYKATRTRDERTQFQKNITSQAKANVSHRRLKRAASTINTATTVWSLSKTAITAGLAFTLATGGGIGIAGTALAGQGVVAAATIGKQYLVRKGIDKLS